MGEYIAIRDCVYNFKFIRKGKRVVGDLDDNENFAPVPAVESDKETPAPAPEKPAKTVADPKEMATRLRAKELKINNWHTKGVEKLLEEIAAAEAALADANKQPDGSSPVGQVPEDDKQPDGKEPEDDKEPDENAGK